MKEIKTGCSRPPEQSVLCNIVQCIDAPSGGKPRVKNIQDSLVLTVSISAGSFEVCLRRGS